jgi:hypothetical protein
MNVGIFIASSFMTLSQRLKSIQIMPARWSSTNNRVHSRMCMISGDLRTNESRNLPSLPEIHYPDSSTQSRRGRNSSLSTFCMLKTEAEPKQRNLGHCTRGQRVNLI